MTGDGALPAGHSLERRRPLVSVVMSVRNAERFVAQAVESILGQTLPDLEVVVVDDGSTDRSAEILSHLARRDARIRLYGRAASAGLADALNFGCEQARGPLIARMDGDDVAMPDRLERQAAFLANHEEVAVVGGAVVLIDEAGRPHATRRPPLDDGRIRAILRRRNCMVHPTVTMRRSALRGVGGYRTAFASAEDYDLWLRLAECHRLANLPDLVLQYRVHREQASFRHLEEQVASTLAAQSVARRRLSGLDDVSMATPRLTWPVLASLGITEEMLEDALAAFALDRAADLADVGQEDLAVAALARTPGFVASPGVRRRTLARYHAKLARRRWRRRQPGRSLASAVRAFYTHPGLVARMTIELWRSGPDRRGTRDETDSRRRG